MEAVRLAMGAAARTRLSAYDMIAQPAGVSFRWAPHLLEECNHSIFHRDSRLQGSPGFIAPPPGWAKSLRRRALRPRIDGSHLERAAATRTLTCARADSDR